MWVRSQDKKSLRDYVSYVIQPSIGSNKHNIQGQTKNSIFRTYDFILGRYSTLENAIEELDNLQNNLKINSNDIYNMN